MDGSGTGRWVDGYIRGRLLPSPHPISMLARLALLFVVVPLVELVLLIQLGRWMGLWPTLGIVVATGVVGAALARAEGLRTLTAFRRETAEGRLPGQPLLDGLAVLVGGAFLLTPGLLTDVAGFSLLLPPSRRWIQRRVRAWIERRIESGDVHLQVWTAHGRTPGGGDDVLDPGKEIRGDPAPGPEGSPRGRSG